MIETTGDAAAIHDASRVLTDAIDDLSLPFDASDPAHVVVLQEVWRLAFPGVAWQGVIAPRWTTLGFQQQDPVSDLRGAGVAGVRHLAAFLLDNHDGETARLLEEHVRPLAPRC